MSGRVHCKQLLALPFFTSLAELCFDFCYVISGLLKEKGKKANNAERSGTEVLSIRNKNGVRPTAETKLPK